MKRYAEHYSSACYAADEGHLPPKVACRSVKVWLGDRAGMYTFSSVGAAICVICAETALEGPSKCSCFLKALITAIEGQETL